jgi:hypothetical protein
VVDALAESLDNLALVATSDRTIVHQLTLANLLLITSVVTLMAANKNLTKMVAAATLHLRDAAVVGDALTMVPDMVPK